MTLGIIVGSAIAIATFVLGFFGYKTGELIGDILNER